MKKKGFTIIEATFSIAILGFAISFLGYLIFNGFNIFNQTKLLNIAQQAHENTIVNIFTLINTNKLRYPDDLENCKLASIEVTNVADCENFDNFSLTNTLETQELDFENVQSNEDFLTLQKLFCTDESCSSFEYKDSEFRSFFISNVNNYEGNNIKVQTYYFFKNNLYKIESNLKI